MVTVAHAARNGASALLGVLAACGHAGEAPAPAAGTRAPTGPPPNVLLVTIDTLRADHLSCFGYFRPTSPRIDALAAQSVFFERAITPCATTLPAHLSIMTGLYPHQHGYVANIGAITGAFQPGPGRVPVAELFHDGGYATGAFVSGATVKDKTGLQAGFDTFDQPQELNRKGADTSARALAWLDEHAAGPAPFFLWVHYWDPHEPNDPPEPYASMFTPDERLEALVDERRVHPDVLEERFPDSEIARLFFPDLFEKICIRREEAEVPEIGRPDVLRVYDLYDGSVRYTDDQVGALLDRLAALDLADDTIVVLVADHGQALGQHDWLEHGRIEWENVHVPMFVRFPEGFGIAPRRVERVVGTVDLMPTVVARLDLPGRDAFLAQASGADVLDPAFDRGWAFSHRSERERDTWEPGRMFSIVVDRWKYYRLEQGDDRLFDLTSDPGELEDVAAEHPDVVAKLRRLVETILADRPAERGPDGPVDAQTLEELRALGYAPGAEHETSEGADGG